MVAFKNIRNFLKFNPNLVLLKLVLFLYYGGKLIYCLSLVSTKGNLTIQMQKVSLIKK